jgi:hypothetical protein
LQALAKAFAFIRRIHICTISRCAMKVSLCEKSADCDVEGFYN